MYRPSELIRDEATGRELDRIGVALSRAQQGRFRLLYKEPAKPQDGETAICDGTEWDPIGDGLRRPVYFDGDLGMWLPLGRQSSAGPGIDGGTPTTVFGGSLVDGGSP